MPGGEDRVVADGVALKELHPAAQQAVAELAAIDDRLDAKLVGSLGVAGGEQVLRDLLRRTDRGDDGRAPLLKKLGDFRYERRCLMLIRQVLVRMFRESIQPCQQRAAHRKNVFLLVLREILSQLAV